MRRKDFHPPVPFEAIIFDCDGTLSHIEGIDELANAQGVGEQVKRLTEEAMGHTGLNPQLYDQRLQWVKPSADQVRLLGAQYFQQKSPDLLAVLAIFRFLQKEIYIISAGLTPAISSFANLLMIESTHVFAVDIYFNLYGEYSDFDRQSPLVHNDGKQRIIQQLQHKFREMALIGDGLNDFAASHLVQRFIGYGGAYYRKNIADQCDYYLKTATMTALLPLCLTVEEVARLDKKAMKLYETGLEILKQELIKQ